MNSIGNSNVFNPGRQSNVFALFSYSYYFTYLLDLLSLHENQNFIGNPLFISISAPCGKTLLNICLAIDNFVDSRKRSEAALKVKEIILPSENQYFIKIMILLKMII